jgi:hypothetical protein
MRVKTENRLQGKWLDVLFLCMILVSVVGLIYIFAHR